MVSIVTPDVPSLGHGGGVGAGDLLGLRAPGQLVQAQLATRQLVTLSRCHGADLNLNKKEYFRLSLS